MALLASGTLRFQLGRVSKCLSQSLRMGTLSPYLSQTESCHRALSLCCRSSPRLPLLQSSSFLQSRGYAKKGKESKQKAKHAAPKPRVELSPGELTELVDIPQMTSRMQATLEHLQMEYVEQLSLRTSVGILDKLPVNTPDGSFPLIQLGQVIQKSPQLIIIDMTGLPQYIGPVKDAILNSGMNLNPQQDGTSLFVPVPAVTREYRENLSKNAKMLCDKTKVKLRNIQNQYTKELNSAKRKHEASTELIKNLEEHIHFQTKQFSEKAEQIMHQKQQELLNN